MVRKSGGVGSGIGGGGGGEGGGVVRDLKFENRLRWFGGEEV